MASGAAPLVTNTHARLMRGAPGGSMLDLRSAGVAIARNENTCDLERTRSETAIAAACSTSPPSQQQQQRSSWLAVTPRTRTTRSDSFNNSVEATRARQLALAALESNATAMQKPAGASSQRTKQSRLEQQQRVRENRQSVLPARNAASVAPPPRKRTALPHDINGVLAQLEARCRADNSFKAPVTTTTVVPTSDTEDAAVPSANAALLHFYEYFVVCGLPAASDASAANSQDPQILHKFPPSAAITPGLSHFCFPTGAPATRVNVSVSGSAEMSAMFRPIDAIYDAQHSFIFTLSESIEGGAIRTLYGVCVLHDVFADDLPTWISATANVAGSPVTPRRSMFRVHTSRAYCFVTRFPYFSLFFQLLYAIVRNEHLRCVDRMMMIPTPATHVLQRTLAQFYIEKVPGANDCLNFSMQYFDDNVRFQCSSSQDNGERYIIVGACLPVLMRTLSMDRVLMLLNLLLLEQSIVLMGSNAGLVSACVIALQSLLYPFVWEGILIPLLPCAMSDYMCAPTPFLMGTVAACPDDLCNKRLGEFVTQYEVIACALDTDTVQLPSRLRGQVIPALPAMDRLHAALSPYFSAIANATNSARRDSSAATAPPPSSLSPSPRSAGAHSPRPASAAAAAATSSFMRALPSPRKRSVAAELQTPQRAAATTTTTTSPPPPSLSPAENARERCQHNARMRVFECTDSMRLIAMQVSAMFDAYYEWMLSELRTLLPFDASTRECLYNMTEADARARVVHAIQPAHQTFVSELLGTMHWIRLLDEVLPDVKPAAPPMTARNAAAAAPIDSSTSVNYFNGIHLLKSE